MNDLDNRIIDIFNSKIQDNPSFWDFKDDYKKAHIHGIIDYPATMVPNMQRELINILIEQGAEINNICDPFMGSGTILVEGMLHGLDVYGVDINPLAYLITKVKTNIIDIKKLNKKIKQLLNRIEDGNLEYEITSFPGIDKWFTHKAIIDLSLIKYAIRMEPNVKYRRILWVIFCQIIREVCNSQKSTFKLHIKKKDDIDKADYCCITEFKKNIFELLERMKQYYCLLKDNKEISNSKVRIYRNNSIKLLNNKKSFKDESIDIIVTSPPYGDNHTTVTYGQFSILQLRWIDIADIDGNIDAQYLDTINKIDKESLGGIYYNNKFVENSGILARSNTLNRIYKKIMASDEPEKARKVASFYIDFEKTLSSCFRVLRRDGYAIFTIGNRRVNNEIIQFNKIILELSEYLNVEFIYDFSRNILNKRIPSKISKLKSNQPVKSMKEENILIFKKL